MAIAPRPYGVGPYGVGPYERYAGTIHDCAGAGSIAWATQATVRAVVQMRARADLSFSLSGVLGKTIDLGAARCDLVFDAVGLGLDRIIGVEGRADLVFDGLAFVAWTWDATRPVPCEAGEWTPADDCGASLWTPSQPGGAGAWASAAADVVEGVWTLPAGCATGVWNSTGLVNR